MWGVGQKKRAFDRILEGHSGGYAHPQMRDHDPIVADFTLVGGVEADSLKRDANDAVAMSKCASLIKIKERGMGASNFGEGGPARLDWRLSCGMVTHDGKTLLSRWLTA
jgi:hypothetical protein